MKLYVDVNAPVSGDGSEKRPFTTIQAAADVAQPGDVVLVAPGVYRENVNPKHAGTADARIEYRSVEPFGAVITGAEPVTDWEPVSGDVWVTRIDNSLFGDYNPYTTRVAGDWFDGRTVHHTGEVYLNDQALYEVTSLAAVKDPKPYLRSFEPEKTLLTWYAEQDAAADQTVIYANFQGVDPTTAQVEINVRKECFFPQQEGIGYLTVSGFAINKAATQWAPPTAFQDGMIGPHWSKGWIIEDCDIANSKCVGISLGKYLQPNNDNKWLKTKLKDGTQTEREAVLQASYEGWDKDHIGSHVIRRNHIHDNGQAGIVGHLGCIFSVIEDNEIDRNNIRQNLGGAETGGIKLHAAIDVIIRRNQIHFNNRGIWLDWQAQGTRVSQNVFYDNTLPFDFEVNEDTLDGLLMGLGEDLWVEVSHGPTLVDNNLMLSDRSLRLAAQGVALVHNLIAGSFCAVGQGTNNNSVNVPSDRYTPYHVPHGTQVVGFMSFLHGDDRFYNNIFVQKPLRDSIKALEARKADEPDEWDDYNFKVGSQVFNDYPVYEEWIKQFEGYQNIYAPNNDRYYGHLPVYEGGNVYFGGATPSVHETDALVVDGPVDVAVEQRADGLYLKTNLFEQLQAHQGIITTATLGEAFEPEQRYENPDGTPITFDQDYFGHARVGVKTVAGPFARVAEADQKLC